MKRAMVFPALGLFLVMLVGCGGNVGDSSSIQSLQRRPPLFLSPTTGNFLWRQRPRLTPSRAKS